MHDSLTDRDCVIVCCVKSIYISRITECGAADRDGRLRVGDKLISVMLTIIIHCTSSLTSV